MMRSITAFLAIATCTYAYAGLPAQLTTEEVHVGNGGDVVVCYSDSTRSTITDIQLLDYYEAQTLRDLTLDMGDQALSVDEKIGLLIERFARFDIGRAEKYREWYRTMGSESRYQLNARLTDIPDSAHVALPRNGHCAVEQIVIHREPMFPTDKRYLFDASLVNWLVDHQRHNDLAGLMMHELIYREAVSDGVQHSIGVRYLNGIIAADQLKLETVRSYIKTLQIIGFKTAFLNGLWLDITEEGSPSFYFGSDNHLSGGFIPETATYIWNGQSLRLSCFVRFYKDGSLQAFSPAGIGAIKVEAFGRTFDVFGLGGFASATPEQCRSRPDSYYDIEFYDDPTKLYSARITTLSDVSSDNYSFKLGHFVTFDPDGNINGGSTSANRDNQWVSIGEESCFVDKGGVAITQSSVRAPLVPCDVTTAIGRLKIFDPTLFDYQQNQIISTSLYQPVDLPPRGRNTLTAFFGTSNRNDPRNEISLDANGHVINGYLAEDTFLCWAHNSSLCSYIPKFSQVFFDDSGLLSHVHYHDGE